MGRWLKNRRSLSRLWTHRLSKKFDTGEIALTVHCLFLLIVNGSDLLPGGAAVPPPAGTRLGSTPLIVLVWFGARSTAVGAAWTRVFPRLQNAHFEPGHMWFSGMSWRHGRRSTISSTFDLFVFRYSQPADESLCTANGSTAPDSTWHGPLPTISCKRRCRKIVIFGDGHSGNDYSPPLVAEKANCGESLICCLWRMFHFCLIEVEIKRFSSHPAASPVIAHIHDIIEST